MRPNVLNPLFSPARALPGVGDKTGRLFDKLLADGGAEARVLDVLFHLPNNCVDRRSRPKIADAQLDQIVTIEATVAEHRPPPPRSRAPYKVLVEDETGDLLLVFFLANHQWIERCCRWASGAGFRASSNCGKAICRWFTPTRCSMKRG